MTAPAPKRPTQRAARTRRRGRRSRTDESAVPRAALGIDTGHDASAPGPRPGPVAARDARSTARPRARPPPRRRGASCSPRALARAPAAPRSRRGRSSFAKFLLHDLAHRVARQLVEVADLARALVRGQQPRDVVDDLLLGRGWSPPAGTIHATMRSPRSGSGSPVTAASLTRGCSSSAALDLARADLEAAALDQVGGPAADRGGCTRRAPAWPCRRCETSRRRTPPRLRRGG